MTTMKLELPTDNATVLFHMSQALRGIAIEGGYVVQEAPVSKSNDLDFDDRLITEMATELQVPVNMLRGESNNASEEDLKAFNNAIKPETPPTDAEQCGKSSVDHDDVSSEIPELIDSKGLPWDKRIHSRGKTRLADDTWRMARKPADKDDDEWSAYVEEVETELLELMEIPVADSVTPPVADVVPPVVTETVTPPVVTETVTPPVADVVPPVADVVPPVADVVPPVADVVPPVADVVPPVVTETVTPPVVTETVVTDAPTTFPLFMKWLTTNNKSLTKDGVDAVLKSHGIASIALLMTRSDLIPQIHADLVKMI